MERTIFIISSVCAAILLIVAAVSDIKTSKIPNWLTVPFYFVGIGLACAISPREMGLRFVGSAIFFTVFVVVLHAMGAGDVKLCMALITVIGIVPAMTTLLIAAILMIIYGFIKDRRCAINKIKNGVIAFLTNTTEQIKKTSEKIPFAPFLLAGYLLTCAGRIFLCLIG